MEIDVEKARERGKKGAGREGRDREGDIEQYMDGGRDVEK